MTLISAADAARLPALYATESVAPADKIAQVKFFAPWTNWTWYGVEFDPSDRLFFGLVVGMETEFGNFSLDELEAVEGPWGLRIERDQHFQAQRLGNVPGIEI